MSITLLTVLVLAAVAVWWLSRQRLAAKPWLEQGVIDEPSAAGRPRPPAAKLGLGVFLAVVAVLFALLASAYSIRMRLGDWQALPLPWLLWLNTVVLIASSVALQWARTAARRGHVDAARDALLAGGATALLFLLGQLLAFRELAAAGFYMASNPASAFFHLITAVHGLHLLGGLAALGRTLLRARRRETLARVALSIELCALYWHFLLLLWIALFAFMLAT